MSHDINGMLGLEYERRYRPRLIQRLTKPEGIYASWRMKMNDDLILSNTAQHQLMMAFDFADMGGGTAQRDFDPDVLMLRLNAVWYERKEMEQATLTLTVPKPKDMPGLDDPTLPETVEVEVYLLAGPDTMANLAAWIEQGREDRYKDMMAAPTYFRESAYLHGVNKATGRKLEHFSMDYVGWWMLQFPSFFFLDKRMFERTRTALEHDNQPIPESRYREMNEYLARRMAQITAQT